MEHTLTPIEKLDFILKYFVEMDGGPYKQIILILDELELDNAKELFEIIHRLIKDGYLTFEITSIKDKDTKVYGSTFDGRLFYNNGGYKAKSLIDAEIALLKGLEADRLRRLDEDSRANQIRLNMLTHWLVWGTIGASIIALLLFLWQIFIYFYPVHKDFSLFFWQK